MLFQAAWAGANIADEVSKDYFAEAAIGCTDMSLAPIFQKLFQTYKFNVTVTNDVSAAEVCGALKNIVACGAGFVDALGYGGNCKAAVIRIGMIEMIRFVDIFYSGAKLMTFLESCGVADLITTCFGGRNREVSEAFVAAGKTLQQLETDMLNGQKLQGPSTAAEVNRKIMFL